MALKTTEQFIAEAKEIHGDVYDYSKVSYTGYKNPVTLICRVPGHGPFRQKPDDLINGGNKCGCPKCHVSVEKAKNKSRSRGRVTTSKNCGGGAKKQMNGETRSRIREASTLKLWGSVFGAMAGKAIDEEKFSSAASEFKSARPLVEPDAVEDDQSDEI